ncbi:MAG: hypothetical protein Q8L47_04180 [bacterium]|nr:hypothetical protein [bacterium]
MENIFKRFQFWLPIIYLLIILIDIGFGLTGYNILAMLTSPPAWFNFFQVEDTFAIAIFLSIGIWYLVGFVIDLIVKKIKSK